MGEFDDVLKTITVTHRKRKGINRGKFDRTNKRLTHRFGKTRKIIPISPKCLVCGKPVRFHHFYCPFHAQELKKQRGVI